MLATFLAKLGGALWHASALLRQDMYPLFGPPGHILAPMWGPFWKVFGFTLAQFWKSPWPFLGILSKPGAHADSKLLDGPLCRRPSACRTRGGGNAACRAKDTQYTKACLNQKIMAHFELIHLMMS